VVTFQEHWPHTQMSGNEGEIEGDEDDDEGYTGDPLVVPGNVPELKDVRYLHGLFPESFLRSAVSVP